MLYAYWGFVGNLQFEFNIFFLHSYMCFILDDRGLMPFAPMSRQMSQGPTVLSDGYRRLFSQGCKADHLPAPDSEVITAWNFISHIYLVLTYFLLSFISLFVPDH
jgi:hypothetical protein